MRFWRRAPDPRLEALERALEEAREETRRLEGRLREWPSPEAVMLADSWARLDRPREKGGLAVTTALPPAETGIAFCSLRTYAASPFAADLFAPHASLSDYADSVDDPRLGAAQAFALAALPRARARRAYAGEAFTFGNSPHHVQSYLALRRRKAGGAVVAHLHEPFLFDLLRAYAKAAQRPLAALMQAAYGERFEAVAGAAEREDSDALARAGVLGAKALFHGVPIDAFAVNSEAAKALLLADDPGLDPARVHVLFHPVFPASAARRARGGALRIGSFGVPGWLKHTPLLIEAFRILRARLDRPVELVLAGFDVDYWTRENHYVDEPGLVRIDAPGDAEFERILADVDLAVQLRARTLGESSGVVAQLIALGVPVLASTGGTFAEFGAAVAPAPDPLDAETLAAAIRRELEAGGSARAAAREAYAQARAPERFCRELKALVEISRRG